MVFAIQNVPLAVIEQEFNHGSPSLSQQMMKIHYHLKCRYFTDNIGDIKLLLIVSLTYLVFTIQIVPLAVNEQYFNHSFSSLIQRKCKFAITRSFVLPTIYLLGKRLKVSGY